jgi:2-polyprenyl-3-methyl-5-hydroxy-6-metoxy-1,4-benzoquinol methylase
MNDLERMQEFYNIRNNNQWSIFNCYPFFLDCKQTYILSKILKDKRLEDKTFLDIGAGEGNFILKLMIFGIHVHNITAVEYLKNRFDILSKKLPYLNAINNDFLKVNLDKQYDIITIMAVLTSITDNDIRYNILDKALKLMSKKGILILYDYFNEDENFLNENYRSLSLSKVQKIIDSHNLETKIYTKVYLKSRYAKGLCKIGLSSLIPFIESLKFFNDNYHFVVVSNEK